jgi:hypothetical protein
VEIQTLQELLHTMNREAVASGLFSNGHRNDKYLRAMGNVYFIDIDTSPKENEEPYYKTIEIKLKALNISFVSVPSKSADLYPYKRHIAVILDSNLPTDKKSFTEVSRHILKVIGADEAKIDNHVAFNRIAFLAPASINKDFINYDERSQVYEGKPLVIPKCGQVTNKRQTGTPPCNTNNKLIKFSDGSTLTAYQAKKLINRGDNKSCYCPNHNDNNPSATFYHNSNGSIHIFCGVCGDVKIDTNFIPTVPTVSHDEYRYSIILNNVPQAKISTLVSKIGNYSYQVDKSIIWSYRVKNINDVYRLLLAKVYLVQKGFSVSATTDGVRYRGYLHTSTLQPIIHNVTLPTPFIPKGVEKSEYFFRHRQIVCYAFEHYIFVEAVIYATYQNIINPTRPFADTCNLGLAYFEYMLKVMHEQKGLKQSSKQYPMRLQGEAKDKITKQRIKNMTKAKEVKMTARQKKLEKLLSDDKYLKPNGEPNKTAIAKKLGVDVRTLYRDLKSVAKKISIIYIYSSFDMSHFFIHLST